MSAQLSGSEAWSKTQSDMHAGSLRPAPEVSERLRTTADEIEAGRRP